VWNKLPRSELVQLVIAPEVSATGRKALKRAVDNLNRAIDGFFTLRFVEESEPDPFRGPFTITVTDVNYAVIGTFCGGNAELGGCT
jgi:hypothetical protein